MTQRGLLELHGAAPKFRISKRGADVSSTDLNDFLIHEDMLVAQPYFSAFIECPFKGETGTYTNKTQTVQVAIPDVVADPFPIIYPHSAGGVVNYPGTMSTGIPGGKSESVFFIEVQVISSTRIDVTFTRSHVSRTSPDGAWLTVYRQAS